jgi:outer membrane biosynthesis protein TonB
MTPQAPQPAGATPPKAEEKKPADKPADKAPDKAPEKSPAAPPPDADEAEAAADALRIQTERAAAAKVAAPAPPAPATETAPATAAAKPVKPPPFNEATHVPMMREKLKELHIGFKQVADYIVAEYRLKPEKPVANLTQLAAESPVSFQNVLFKHLVNPDKLAKIRGYAGQMTVEE